MIPSSLNAQYFKKYQKNSRIHAEQNRFKKQYLLKIKAQYQKSYKAQIQTQTKRKMNKNFFYGILCTLAVIGITYGVYYLITSFYVSSEQSKNQALEFDDMVHKEPIEGMNKSSTTQSDEDYEILSQKERFSMFEEELGRKGLNDMNQSLMDEFQIKYVQGLLERQYGLQENELIDQQTVQYSIQKINKVKNVLIKYLMIQNYFQLKMKKKGIYQQFIQNQQMFNYCYFNYIKKDNHIPNEQQIYV